MATDVETPVKTPGERPIGFGRLKRKEDPRFIRGQGNYVDDLKLPGMLHGAILRSPFAHAKIVSIGMLGAPTFTTSSSGVVESVSCPIGTTATARIEIST